MINVKGFFKKNKNKKMTVGIWFRCAYYRSRIRFFDIKKIHKRLGAEGEETPFEDLTKEEYLYAMSVGRCVNRSAHNTPWESKCLVQAMTAQHYLKKKNISTTLYLGVGTENGKMVAHAWIRAGKLYVTGGDGKEYAIVSKYVG